MQLLKSSFWTLLWIGVKVVCSFFINKIVSVFYGPLGIALLSHIQNFFAAFLILCQEGINKGMIKSLSHPNLSSIKQNTFITAGAVFSGLAYLIIALLSIIFIHPLATLFHVSQPWLWLGYGLLGMGLLVVHFFVMSIFLAWQKIRLYSLLNIAGSIITVPLVYIASKYGKIDFMLLAATCGMGFMGIVGFIIFKFNIHKTIAFSFDKLGSAYKDIWQFVIMAAGIMIFGKFTEIGLRQFAIVQFSLEEVGLWQSVVKLSDYYTAAFTSLLSVIYFPKIASLLSEPRQLRQFVFQIISWFVPIIIIGLCIVYVLRKELMVFFFNESFLAASNFVLWQVVADALKLASFFFVFITNAEGRTKLFLILDASSAIVSVVFSFAFAKIMGIEGLLVAQVVRYVFYLAILIFVYRKLIWMKVE